MEKVLSQWMPSELIELAPRSLRRQWFTECVIILIIVITIHVTTINDFLIVVSYHQYSFHLTGKIL